MNATGYRTTGRKNAKSLLIASMVIALVSAGTYSASGQPVPAEPSNDSSGELAPIEPFEPLTGPIPPPIGWQQGDPEPAPDGNIDPGPGQQQRLSPAYIPTDLTNDPDTSATFFPVRGESDSPDSSLWKNMTTKISSFIGNSTGTYIRLMDQLNFRFAVTMVSQRPVVSSFCYYSPVGEDIQYLDYDTHLTLYLIVNGVQVDFMNTESFSCDGTRTFQIDHTVNHPNQTIQLGVRAWTANVEDQYQTSGVKTAPFFCDPLEPGEVPPGQGTLCRPA